MSNRPNRHWEAHEVGDPAGGWGHTSWRETLVAAQWGTSSYKIETLWCGAGMTSDHVKEILDRVLTWPAERQADVAHMIELMEEQDNSAVGLSDAQLAEVQRRLNGPKPNFLTLEEVRERFAQRRA